jgi:hypothetical protein
MAPRSFHFVFPFGIICWFKRPKTPAIYNRRPIRVPITPPTLSPSFAKKIVLDTSIIGCKPQEPQDLETMHHHYNTLRPWPVLFPGVLLAKNMGPEAKRVMGCGIGVA